ncbi:MAG: serine hydrolase domain-containing protein [Chloroflexota bacterium]|nr:serine hydrolase domain-containing protein [Chloroflexota bacterium]
MADVRAVFEPIVQAHLGDTFPACALTVVHQGTPIVDAAWGWIDPDTQDIPVTIATYFDLASITKLFTTLAFLTLVRDGKVRVDDALVGVVPEFSTLNPRAIDGGQDPHSKQHLPTPPDRAGQTVDPTRVTFRHLLTHTSGLPPWRDVYNVAGEGTRADRWSRSLSALVRYPFVAPPDGIVRYSDIGLLLLGEAVARLHGAGDLETAIAARVLSTLVPHHIVYNPMQHGIPRERIAPTEDDPTWRKRRVWGEVHDENACGVGGVAGHAGLFATAQAVAAFGAACLDMSAHFGLSPALSQEVLSLQAESDGQRRGLGFALKAAQDSSAGDHMSMRTFGHTGFTGTSLWIDPETRLVVALLTNSVYPGRTHGGTHEFRRAIHNAVAEMTGMGG